MFFPAESNPQRGDASRDEDPFEKCHALRLRLAETFPGREWEDLLPRYGDLMDCRDAGAIDNFAAASLALVSNQEMKGNQWSSTLDGTDAASWLDELGVERLAQPEHFSSARIRAMIPASGGSNGSDARDFVEELPASKGSLQPSFANTGTFQANTKQPSKHTQPTRKLETRSVSPDNKTTVFQTAREELAKQRQQRGVANGNEPPRKCLGPRRHASFVPPFVKDVAATTPGNQQQPGGGTKRARADEEEPEDERLAQVDAKMVALIRAEIMSPGPARVSWDDVAGLAYAKATIQEMVVWPLLRPDLFTGLRAPPRGLLLFGPPGTGKTLLGRCIAAQADATFFSVSAATLTSKWVGDGEKMVRALFAVARCHQPAVVFIDEIDSMLTARSDSEHESSRRLKTEFLVQLDGAGVSGAERVLVVGATNRPQELDDAARRRLVKRLYIPLPDQSARQELLWRLLSAVGHELTQAQAGEVAALADGFSGADLRALAAEAALAPVRQLGAGMVSIPAEQVRPVNLADFKAALTRIKPSVAPGDLEAYAAWDRTFGCGS